MNQRWDDTEQMTTSTMASPAIAVILGGDSKRPSVEALARQRLADKCTYAFCFNQVTFSYSQGVLTLAGRLPSFYLKQMLQTLLRDLDSVTRINNRVDVVSSTGLSSVRPPH
jgi:hypothetical protein